MFFDVGGFPSTERIENRRGERNALPRQYGETPVFAHVAGEPGDIAPANTPALSSRIRRAHSIIWAGGRRDPLMAFDEWSKLLFAKVIDERTTQTRVRSNPSEKQKILPMEGESPENRNSE